MQKFNRSLIATAVAFFLVACATQNETAGTVGGAVVGGVIGKVVGGDRGAIVGAALGAALGNQFGKHLDAQDKQRLVEARMKALEVDRQQRFYAESAKSFVVVTPSRTFYEPSRRTLALANDLRQVDIVEIDPESVAASLDIPIYRDINFNSAPKLNVPKGSVITRLAQVRNDPRWVLVGDRDFGLGYAPAYYFDKQVVAKLANATASTGGNDAVAGSPRAERRTQPVPSNKPAEAAVRPRVATTAPVTTKTDELLASDKGYLPPASHLRQPAVSPQEYARTLNTGNRAAAAKSVNVQYVKPAVECKELTSVLLSNDKETDKEVTKSCRKPGGAWM